MNNILWYGIVENRGDPLRLGRVQVRISGVHTDNISELPTKDLPWAIPIQSVTSAALSGIGESATGLLEGSMVVCIFADESKQVPLIIGSIAGVPTSDSSVDSVDTFDSIKEELAITPPESPPAPVVETPDGEIHKPEDMKEVPPGSKIIEPGYLGTLTESQYNKLKAKIAEKESGNDYKSVNDLGFLGKYQFGAAFLSDVGYIHRSSLSGRRNLQVVNDTASWTGKEGMTSKAAFLGNPTVQEKCMDTMLKRNFKQMCKARAISPESPPEKIAGALMAAHLKGAGPSSKNPGAVDYVRDGINSKDAYGTSTEKYYKLGYALIAGKETVEAPTPENINKPAIDRDAGNINLSNSKYDIIPGKNSQSKQGFADPNSKYPLSSHIDEPDTPRLATGIKTSQTIVGEKEAALEKTILVANSSATWSQSPVPYNAHYPYNHVYQSECGHVMEFDDTKGAERINLHHKAGTFIEIDAEGNQTNKVRGIRTVIVEEDELVYIKGSGHVSIDGDTSVRVGGACQVEILGDANLRVHGNFNTQVDGSYNVYATGAINFKSAANINADGTKIYLNSGTSTASAIAGYSPSIIVPAPVTREEAMLMSLEGDPESTRKLMGSMGASTPAPAGPVDDTPPDPDKVKPVTGICGFDSLSYATRISPNYTLRDLCYCRATQNEFAWNGQNGISAEEIACNLKQLCINVIEPLRAKYASDGFGLNSCFRLRKKGVSQHEYGMAVDITFSKIRHTNTDRAEFYKRAQEIKNLVPFDQLLLEFNDKGHVWIHVSFSTKQQRGEVMTFNNDSRIAYGLKQLGQVA